MAAYAQDSSFFTRRGIVVVAIIALHVLVAWALASGLAHKVVEVLAPPIEADIVEEVKKEDEPPPPPPPEMERPPVEVPPPEVSIDLPMETTTTAIQDVTDKPPPPAPPPPPRVAGTPAKMTRAGESGRLLPAGLDPPRRAGLTGRSGLRGSEWPPAARTGSYRNFGFPGSRRRRRQGRQGDSLRGGHRGLALRLPESCIKFKVKFVLKNN